MPRRYPKESAGRAMVTNVPVVYESMKVGEIEQLLIDKTKDFETINYIYLIDRNKKFKGAISVKEIFRSPKTRIAKKLLTKKIVSVKAHTDQERAVYLALKNSLKAIPVISKDRTFLGTIPHDTILKILYRETTEDILHLGGVTEKTQYENILTMPVFKAVRHRTPWLVIGLFGGLLAALVVDQFEEVLASHIILTAFIPLIVYMSGAVCAQTQAFVIRDLAMNPNLNFTAYFFKQGGITISIGVITSILLFFVSKLIYSSPGISTVLGIALFFAVLTSLITGLFVPFFFNKIKLDPADASGPIATIIQDIISVSVYLAVASLILS